MESVNLEERTYKEFQIFKIVGTERITMHNSQKLARIATAEVKRGAKNFVIDLKNIDHIDSSGLGVFLTIRSALEDVGSPLRMVNIQPAVMDIMKTVKIETIFAVFDSEEDIA